MKNHLTLFALIALASPLALPSLSGQAQTGPGVTIPAAVSLSRPTAGEVTQINDELKTLLVQTDPSIEAIFAKYPAYRMVAASVNTAIIPAPFNPQRHTGLVALAQKGDIDLLFAGDSITDFWQTNGKEQYAKYFGNIKVADFAISGDKTQGVLYRLQNGEGQGFQPKAIMLMIGTNNTGSNTAAEIAEGVGADIAELRKDFPNAKILLLAVFPRGRAGDLVRATIADINQRIAKLDDGKNVFYLDIGEKFLGPDGNFLPGTFMGDNLHPVAAGYEIWAQAVKEPLSKLLGQPIPAPAPAAATPAK